MDFRERDLKQEHIFLWVMMIHIFYEVQFAVNCKRQSIFMIKQITQITQSTYNYHTTTKSKKKVKEAWKIITHSYKYILHTHTHTNTHTHTHV